MFFNIPQGDDSEKRNVNKKRLIRMAITIAVIVVIVVIAVILLPFVYRTQLEGVWVHEPIDENDRSAIIEIKDNEVVYANSRVRLNFFLNEFEWNKMSWYYMLGHQHFANYSRVRYIEYLKVRNVETLRYGDSGNMYDFERVSADYTLLD